MPVSVTATACAPTGSGRAGRVTSAVVNGRPALGITLDLTPQHQVFLSTPMAALASPDYAQARADAEAVAAALNRVAGPVYWPAGGIGTADRFEAPDLATEANLAALEQCGAFVLYQPEPLTRPTSCHVELGMALALDKPVTVFTADGCLPYMLNRFEAVAARRGGWYRSYLVGDALRLLDIHGAPLIGLPAAVAA
jgi:hypothetical protein